MIEIPGLRLRLFAGSGGLDRGILWAHASELPDPAEWLEAGALVMTTGLGLPDEPEAQGAYIERLARAGLGGMLVGEEAEERIHAPELTPRLAEVADENSLPVLLMPYELPFSGVARVVAEANHDVQDARIGQALRLHDTVRQVIMTASGQNLVSRLGGAVGCDLHVVHPETGEPVFAESSHSSSSVPTRAIDQIAERFAGDPASGPAIARFTSEDRAGIALDIPASRPATLVAVSNTADQPDLFVLRHIAAVVALEVEKLRANRESGRRMGAELLAGLLASRYAEGEAAEHLAERGLPPAPWVVASFPSRERTGYSDLHLRLAERGVPHLLERGPGTFVALLPADDRAVETLTREVAAPVGLSCPVAAAARVPDGYWEAVWALKEAESSGRGTVRYGGEGMSAFLPGSLEESREMVRRVLGPLLRYDEDHGTSLVASLRAYLAHDRSLKATCEELHVHKQTVVYRMRRVEQLTGRRLGSMDHMVSLWLALKMLNVLVTIGGAGAQSKRA